jgi:hypothetical protein
MSAQGAQRISGFTPVSGAGGFGLAGTSGLVGVPVPGRKPEKPPPPSPPPQAERAQARASAEKSRTEGNENRMMGFLGVVVCALGCGKKNGAMKAPRTGQTARLGKTRYTAMKER